MTRKAKKKSKSKSRLRVNYALVVGLAAVALAVVWLFYPTYQVRLEQEKQIAAIKRQYAELKEQNEALRQQIREIKRPEYIERYAREKMGLVKPGEKAYVVLPPSRSTPATRTAVRAAEATRSAESSGTWERVKAFFAALVSR